MNIHTLGNAVDISSYNLPSNPYTVPNDGYILLIADAGGYALANYGTTRLALSRSFDGTNSMTTPLFVRAGMEINVSLANGACSAKYIPFE